MSLIALSTSLVLARINPATNKLTWWWISMICKQTFLSEFYKQKHDAWLSGSQFNIFASLVSGNICFINLAAPNKDKIRDF